MKKVFTIFISLSLLFTMVGCSTTDIEKNTSTQTTKNEQAVNKTLGKTLVAYYSASGNTKKVANDIAEATGAKIFELKPADPYSDADLNFNDDNSRIVYEHNNFDAKDIKLVENTIANWESYDTVFIGYPIWWGIAAWPINNFIKSNDFTGKRVVPFATSTSSELGVSGELLAEMTETGTWMEGERFSSDVSKDVVIKWIEGLD